MIDVMSPAGIHARGARITVDGVRLATDAVALVDDGRTHDVRVEPETEGALTT
jgi:hypothetical protein